MWSLLKRDFAFFNKVDWNIKKILLRRKNFWCLSSKEDIVRERHMPWSVFSAEKRNIFPIIWEMRKRNQWKKTYFLCKTCNVMEFVGVWHVTWTAYQKNWFRLLNRNMFRVLWFLSFFIFALHSVISLSLLPISRLKPIKRYDLQNHENFFFALHVIYFSSLSNS